MAEITARLHRHAAVLMLLLHPQNCSSRQIHLNVRACVDAIFMLQQALAAGCHSVLLRTARKLATFQDIPQRRRRIPSPGFLPNRLDRTCILAEGTLSAYLQ